MKTFRFFVILAFIFTKPSFYAFAESPSTPPLSQEQSELFKVGCQAKGDGYCSSLNYDTSMEFYQLIQFTEHMVSDDHFELVTELSWEPSIDSALQFVEDGSSKKLAKRFELLIGAEIDGDAVRSIMSLRPTEYCDEPEICNYMYFLVYLNKGQLLFFHWKP